MADFQMASQAHLASQDHVIAKLGTTRDAGLGNDQAVLAQSHVVGDLNQIIYFCSFADNGRSKRAAIDGDIGADFNIVTDDDVANLRHFEMSAGIEHISEAIGADNCAGVNADAIADFGAGIKDDTWKKVDLLAKLAVGAEVVAALQN